jgi:hypothetical protein
MNFPSYIYDLHLCVPEPYKEHFTSMESRVAECFSEAAKLERIPNLDALRLRLNEKQLPERLDQAQDNVKQLAILNDQRKLRANYCSAVLLAHQIHLEVKFVWDQMGGLLQRSEEYSRRLHRIESLLMSNCAYLALLYLEHCHEPRQTAQLLTSVPDLEPGLLQEAVRELFDAGLSIEDSDSFAEPLELYFIERLAPGVERVAKLEEAFAAASAAWKRYEYSRSAYINTKSNLNPPQYAARLAQAIRSQDNDKGEKLKEEFKLSKLHLHIAATSCNHFYSQLAAAREMLWNALQQVAAHIDDSDLNLFKPLYGDSSELLRHKVRNNCICARILIGKMDKPGPRPDPARFDNEISGALKGALRSLDPHFQEFHCYLMDGLG